MIVSKTEGIVVDRIDQRIWYVVAAVVVLLLPGLTASWPVAGLRRPEPAKEFKQGSTRLQSSSRDRCRA